MRWLKGARTVLTSVEGFLAPQRSRDDLSLVSDVVVAYGSATIVSVCRCRLALPSEP